jgi:pimeloyl-ACP methyl ester carboxylesterase
VLPGSGSAAGFVTRAFGPALAAAGYALVAPEPEPGPGVVEAAFAALDDAVGRHDVRLVGGVSLGAHVAARWAAARPATLPRLRGLLLALPAWTGPPGAVAAASAAAAARVRALGVARAVDLARRDGVPWVADELALAWPGYGGALADTLEAAARSAGPLPAELARITLPVGLAAFVDDPLHPVAVAEHWASVLPRAVLHRLALADCAADRAALGGAAVSAWLRASEGGGHAR